MDNLLAIFGVVEAKTMQVVRNYVLSFKRTAEKKIRKIILAFKLKITFKREKIFEFYFNKVIRE
ncbi:MAG: hypothetical protein CM15mP22_5880 [Gammaproteobacteria bacterium]|nr:MAG: hypothetical protein CM15mP22_5880 [Gammaproteobacteria bacterium]